MFRTFAVTGLAAALALSPLAALAQSDSSGAAMPDKTMSDQTMAPKKPMAKHHTMHHPMHKKTMSHSGATSGDDMQKKM